jgi:hypothetical protein
MFPVDADAIPGTEIAKLITFVINVGELPISSVVWFMFAASNGGRGMIKCTKIEPGSSTTTIVVGSITIPYCSKI